MFDATARTEPANAAPPTPTAEEMRNVSEALQRLTAVVAQFQPLGSQPATASNAALPSVEEVADVHGNEGGGDAAALRRPAEALSMEELVQQLREEVRRLKHGMGDPAVRPGPADAAGPPHEERRDDQPRDVRRGRADQPGHGGRSRSRQERGRSRSQQRAPQQRHEGSQRARRGGGGDPPSSDDSSDSDGQGRRGGGDRRRRSESRSSESSSDGDRSGNPSDGQQGGRPRRERRTERGRRGGREYQGRRSTRRRRERRRRREESPERATRKSSVKDLELPVFTPTPGVSVSTWTERVDLILQGARASGRGEWDDHALYFILGAKLQGNGSRWWTNLNRRLTDEERTWTHLKKALLRRYGPREDLAAAEHRVYQRTRFTGESHADFAAGLRDAADRNDVQERVLLSQFYRGLDKTTRLLVKQNPEPEKLEEAVERAMDIDDPMDELLPRQPGAGQVPLAAWTAGATSVGNTGERVISIPGVGSIRVPAAAVEEGAIAPTDPQGFVLYTNPQGVWNERTGIYEAPAGRKWNTRYWAEETKPKKTPQRAGKKAPARREPETSDDEADAKPRRKKKPKRATESSDEELEEKPRKKLKAAVRQLLAEESGGRKAAAPTAQPPLGARRCYRCGQEGHLAPYCTTGLKCFACNQNGHFARDCPDPIAKARSDALMKKRQEKASEEKGNEERAS
jgi:hypothetical protein